MTQREYVLCSKEPTSLFTVKILFLSQAGWTFQIDFKGSHGSGPPRSDKTPPTLHLRTASTGIWTGHVSKPPVNQEVKWKIRQTGVWQPQLEISSSPGKKKARVWEVKCLTNYLCTWMSFQKPFSETHSGPNHGERVSFLHILPETLPVHCQSMYGSYKQGLLLPIRISMNMWLMDQPGICGHPRSALGCTHMTPYFFSNCLSNQIISQNKLHTSAQIGWCGDTARNLGRRVLKWFLTCEVRKSEQEIKVSLLPGLYSWWSQSKPQHSVLVETAALQWFKTQALLQCNVCFLL